MDEFILVEDGLPTQPTVSVPVSESVLVVTEASRILIGYYDFSRSRWYATGMMDGERIVKWKSLK